MGRAPPRDKDVTDAEVQAAREVLASLLTAMKNYGLYPSIHVICQKSILNVHTRLANFLEECEKLRLDVEKDRLLLNSQVVHHDATASEKLAFILFRDGIEWLEFEKGVEQEEILGFLQILHKYRDSQDEAEGDLVTALWEAQFEKVQYKTSDIYWDSEPLLDLSLLSAGGPENAGIEEDEAVKESAAYTVLQNIDPGLWKLTPEELGTLNAMVRDEEERDTSQDMLDVMLALLNDQGNEKDLSNVLEFLEGEFQDAISQGDFGFSYKLVVQLHRMVKACSTSKPWALPVLGHFFKRLSSPHILGALSRVWPTLDSLDSDKVRMLRQFLLLLPSQAILALAPMLGEIRSASVQRQLMQIIAILARRNLRPLEQLLDQPEEFMAKKLIVVLGYLKGERPTELLLKMVQHPSERVRRQAVRQLLTRGDDFLKRTFPLIDDPGDSVRTLILDHLGSKRNRLAEELLLNYLDQARFKVLDHRHLLSCFETLGRCGSCHAIPFLQSSLFNRGWIPDLGHSIHRKGAVVALVALGTEEAIALLHKASRSLRPGVRLAYRRALQAN